MTPPAERKQRHRREELSHRAVSVAAAVAQDYGLRVVEPAVLGDLFSHMVHLKPAPVVARVATRMPRLRSPIEQWMEREIAVTTFLSERGAPVVAPSVELPPGPHERDGFWVSFWSHVQPDPGRTPTAEDCSAMLKGLHAVLREYPDDLPTLCADDVRRGLELLDRSDDLLNGADVNLLRASAERLSPLWETPNSEARALHGDAHPGNLIAARGGGLVWIDFEDACLGPPEWDLATIGDEGAVARYHDPDPEMLARCAELRALQVALALIVFRDDFGHMEGWDASIRVMLDTLIDASRRG